MAHTTIETGNALAPVIVQAKLFKDQIKQSFFSNLMSEKGDNVVFVKNDFTKKKGDTMTFGIRYRNTGNPITGNATVKGKEDKLQFKSFQVTLERYRYALMDDGSLTRQRFVGDIPTETRQALQDWGAEQIDQMIFDAITDSPTNIVYAGSATSIATLTASDLITPANISKLKALALTQRGNNKVPIRPIMIGGKKHLVLLVSPDVAFDLKQDSTYNQAQREAQVRGEKNPIFTGALGVWDNVIIFEHENIPILSNGGSGADVTYSKNVLMGAQAVVFAWGERPSIVEESEDYGEFMGYCWRMTARAAKPKFDNKDYGSIAYYCADTRPTGRTKNIR